MLEMQRRGFDPWVRKTLWRRKWQPTVVFLAGKSHGQQRSLEGYCPWSCKRVGHNWETKQQGRKWTCLEHLCAQPAACVHSLCTSKAWKVWSCPRVPPSVTQQAGGQWAPAGADAHLPRRAPHKAISDCATPSEVQRWPLSSAKEEIWWEQSHGLQFCKVNPWCSASQLWLVLHLKMLCQGFQWELGHGVTPVDSVPVCEELKLISLSS